MTADEFAASSIALLRSSVGWQTRIAHRLGIEPRTVRRWLQAGATPAWVDARFREWLGSDEGPHWPRDEWIIGDAIDEAGRRREYIVHTRPPRFIARVVLCDADGQPIPDETPADVLRGVTYSADEETLICEITWIDEPAPGEIVGLMEAAADVLDRSDA